MSMKYHILDRTGHTTLDFVDGVATTQDDSGNPEVIDAMAKFAELVGTHKYTAAKRDAPGQLTQIRAFDPSATEIVFVPPLQGG